MPTSDAKESAREGSSVAAACPPVQDCRRAPTSISLRRWVKFMGLAVALTTAVSGPAGYLTMGYYREASTSAALAQHSAQRIGRYITEHRTTWDQDFSELAGALDLPGSPDRDVHQRLYVIGGRLIFSHGQPIEGPVISRAHVVRLGTTPIGWIEIDRALRPLLQETGIIALFAFALGFAVYFVLRVLPLRVLDRTVGELIATNAAFTIVNRELEQQNRLLQEREEELRTQNMRFNAAINNMSQGLCMFDGEERLVIANERYARMYGLASHLIAPGTSFREIIHHRVSLGVFAGSAPEDYIRERLAAVREGKASTKIQELSDGRTIAISHQPMAGGGWVATHEDITEQLRIQARMAHMAHHDALTDLANRVLLRERMEQALNLKDGERVAILCLDLDRFKAINDTLGHPVGDELLKAVGERLRRCVRKGDTIARLGGDEFAVLQVSRDQPRDATKLARRICQAISEPFDLGEHHVVVDTSVGIAVTPDDGDNPDMLLKNADLALYRAKSDGRGTFRFFEPEMDTRMKERRDLEIELRRALHKGQLQLYYQPLVNLATNAISGFEALLRWQHPVNGLIPPADFIPLAEEIGLIIPIGEWVLREACKEAASWPGDLKVAVNLSPTQFKSRTLVQTVVSALASSGLAPQRLELEITESVLLHDNEATLKRLHQLRELGVRISMDDFGTGYSSLSYLRNFPFDKIKIDRSFVGDLAHGDDAVAIVRAVANLAARLGMATTAEGVETEEQLERIRAEGCTEMQGYLFSPPRPAAEIARLFLHQERDKAVTAA